MLEDYISDLNDNFIYMNTGSHQFLRRTESKYKYPQSAFYLAEYENRLLRDEVISDLKSIDYLIIQNDDNHFVSFFNELSSYDNMMRIDEFRNLITNDFELDTLLDGRYYIYNRK